MKRLILLIFCFGLYFQVFSQGEKKIELNQIEKDAITYKDYLDPTFPDITKAPSIQNPPLEEYAKLHPPVPKSPLTGDIVADQANYIIIQDNWFAANPYFPQLI